MMYEALYRYFIQHRQLHVPGVGTFLLERKSAVADFPNRLIHPPSYHIALQPSEDSPSRNLFSWLAREFGISERDAVIRFNDFVFDLKQGIRNGDSVIWDGVGTLRGGLGGEIRFDPAVPDITADMPVKAEKVIREKAEHRVRVGEDEKTSAQMIEWLNKPADKRNYWWAWALAVGLAATMFIGWYFSEHGMKASSSGNQQKFSPKEAAPAYRNRP